jgi:hypothetical protein
MLDIGQIILQQCYIAWPTVALRKNLPKGGYKFSISSILFENSIYNVYCRLVWDDRNVFTRPFYSGPSSYSQAIYRGTAWLDKSYIHLSAASAETVSLQPVPFIHVIIRHFTTSMRSLRSLMAAEEAVPFFTALYDISEARFYKPGL